MPTISIIIVSFNTREMTLACLRSVFNQTPELDFEIIVVDNASTDGSADAIEALFPQVRLIRSDENLGFARANNLAAQEASSSYLLLLNPDTVILDRAVERLVTFAKQRPKARIWGGRSVFGDGSLNPQSCWGRITLWSAFCHATGLANVFHKSEFFNPERYGGWPRDSVREVDIVAGSFLLIERALWDQLGGFDEAYFMYGEEADLCLRSHTLGAKPAVTPEACIVHYGGASERSKADKIIRLYRARIALMCRHWNRLAAWFGRRFQELNALHRLVAWSVLAAFRRGDAAEQARTFRAVWASRSKWSSHRV